MRICYKAGSRTAYYIDKGVLVINHQLGENFEIGERLRKSGIDEIGDVPWGTHFCQFYQTKEDLVEILVPYFKAGLESNELCVWITSQPLEVEEAKEAMKKAVPDIDVYLEKGQMEIIPYTHGYIKGGAFDPDRIVNSWFEKIDQAMASGYDGLRASGDNRWLEKEGWVDLVDYEKKVDAIVDKHHVIALCPYYLDMCITAEIIDVISNHQFALIKREGKWEQIESSRRRKAEERASQTVSDWEQTFDSVPDLVAIIDNEYRIVRTNQAMAAKLGLTPEECTGLTCYHAVHGTNEPPSFCPHRQLLKDGLEHTAEVYEDCFGGYFLVSVSPLHDLEGKLIGSIHVARDINEQKRLEESLRESEEKYRNIIETVNEGILIVDTEFRAIYVNKKIEEMLGYSQEEILGKSSLDFTDEKGKAICRLIRKNIQKGINESNELRVIHKDRSFIWMLVNTRALFDKDGKFTGGLSILTDITTRKQEEHRRCRYNSILEGINWIFSNVMQAKTEEEVGNACLSVALEVTGSEFGFINEMDADGLLHDVAKSELGWEQCLMYDKTGHRRPPSDYIVHGLYGSVIKSGKGFFTNDPLSHPDSIGLPHGHPPITSFLGVPLIQDGKTVGLIAVANREGGYSCEQQEDLEAIAPAVTQALQRKKEEQEREHAERELLESDERFLSVLENSLDSAYRMNLQSKHFDYMSPVIERITGFSVNDIDAMSSNGLLDRIHPDDRPRVIVEIARSLEEGFGAHEYRFKCKDGKYRWLADHFSIIKDKTGMACFRAGIVRDITGRKKAEEALRLSNIYNRSLIEASLDPLVTIGHDGKITDVNGATEQVTGYSRDELIGTDFSDYFTKPEKARKGYQQVFTDGKVWNYPLEIQHKDGRITPVLYNASVYKDEAGTVIGVFAAARDITERKKAEEKIQILANVVESSEDAIITKSLDGTITSWNKGAEKVYGYLAGEVLGKNISMLEPDDLKGQIKHFSEKIKHGERIQHYETLRLKKDGTKIDVSVTFSPVFDTSGELVAISTIARDITDQKKAGEALRLSNIYNRSLIEASLDPLVTIGPDGKITDVNDATELVTGYPRDELIGSDFSDYFTEPEKARKGYQQVFICGEVRDYTLEIQNKSGHVTPVLYNASIYKDETGKVIGVFAAARDVTERKKAEEALKKAYDNLEQLIKKRTQELEKAYESLKESEEGLAEAQRMAHIGNWDWNVVTGEVHWSDELYSIFGRSPQKSAPSYNELLNYIHPEDRDYVDKSIKKGLKKGPKKGIEYRIILANGEERTVYSQAEVIFDEQNFPVRVKGIVQDITERVKAEETMAKIDKIRIKEIHHRIKNNLQVISSLLDLQAERFSEKEVLEAFRESQNRVISMTLIHEELYKGEGTDTLDFSTYLQKLAENLFQTYNLQSNGIRLYTNLEENTFFDMDIAVPLGIIVNELISNSLKHAFTKEEEGEIRIKLCREKKGYEMHKSLFCLTISDNGKGIPENTEFERLDSLGLQLVSTLVDQLEGKIELERNHGTEFRITFNVAERS